LPSIPGIQAVFSASTDREWGGAAVVPANGGWFHSFAVLMFRSEGMTLSEQVRAKTNARLYFGRDDRVLGCMGKKEMATAETRTTADPLRG